MKNSSFKVGQSVVYKRANGDSISAKVITVGLHRVGVSWPTGPQSCSSENVERADWNRLTPFGDAMFLALS